MVRSDVTRIHVRGHLDHSYNIAVSGPLDGRAANALRRFLEDFACDCVMLDLTECRGVTAAALDSLAAASRTAATHGGSLTVRPTLPVAPEPEPSARERDGARSKNEYGRQVAQHQA